LAAKVAIDVASDFHPRVGARLIVGVVECIGQELMARVTHAAQIDLRFSGPAREFLDFGTGVGPGDFAGERFNLLGQGWIGTHRQAQSVAKSVSRCVGAAPRGSRAGAGRRVGAVCLGLAGARHVTLVCSAEFAALA
jgi:hypothetical protein